jgi:hypothetical protein
MPDGYVMADLGWDIETVSKGFTELFRNGFCNRCERTKWVLINSFLKWNPIQNENVAKGRKKEFELVPRKFMYYNKLANEILQNGKHLPNGFERVLKGFRNPEPEPEPEPIDNLSKHTDKLSLSSFEEKPEKRKSDRAKPVKAEVVQQVFDCWKSRLSTNGAKLDARRTEAIKKIIRLGYTVEDCEKAFIGCERSYYHNGFNKQGKRYCDLELILRDAKNIDRFQIYADNPPKPSWRDGDEPSLEVMRRAQDFYRRVTGNGNVIDNETGELI